MQRGSGFRWAVLLLLILGSAALSFSNMIFASRPTDVMLQFGMDQAQLTAISSIGFVPGAVFSIVLGNFFDRKGAKAVRYFGALMLFLGAVFLVWRIFANDYVQLVIITFCAGTLFLPTQVLPAKMLGAWFPREQMGTAMGLWGAASGLGITVAFFVGAAVPTIQVGFTICAVVLVVVACLWLLWGKMPQGQEGQVPGGAEQPAQAGEVAAAGKPKVSVAAVLKSKNMWVIMISCGIVAATPLMINTYMVNAFVDKGLDPLAASMLGVVFNLSLVAGSAIAGIITSKLGRYNLPFLVMCVGGGALFLITYLAPAGPATFALLVCAGLVCAGTVGCCLARVSLLHLTGDFGPENTGIAGGVNNTGMGLFPFLLPTLVAMAAGSNYLAIFIVAFAVLAVAGVLGSVCIPELGEKGKLARRARGELEQGDK